MILITGGKGQVGQCFQEIAAKYPHEKFQFVDVDVLDITSKKAVEAFFKANPPSWVINCAAYTAVDKAETDKALAKKINVVGPKILAETCAKYNLPLVHISTDYVYHNRQNTPFKEGDSESPKGVYAATKQQGDRAALKANPLTMILRTSWVYSHVGNNFVKTMLKLGKERPALSVVFDQIGTPTFAPDLVEAIMSIIQKVDKKEVDINTIHGIWHYSNEGVSSWYDFAAEIFAMENIACKVSPIETKDYPTPAKRPHFSVLNKAKIKAHFGLNIPHWRASLGKCLDLLREEK
jgi:dTDP-4-dehydrorhamnose reductase